MFCLAPILVYWFGVTINAAQFNPHFLILGPETQSYYFLNFNYISSFPLVWKQLTTDPQFAPFHNATFDLMLLKRTDDEYTADNFQVLENYAMKAVSKQVWDENLVAIFGPHLACKYEARLASTANKFMGSYSCEEQFKEGHDRFQTFMQMMPTEDIIIDAVMEFIDTFKWKKIAVIQSVSDTAVEDVFRSDLLQRIQSRPDVTWLGENTCNQYYNDYRYTMVCYYKYAVCPMQYNCSSVPFEVYTKARIFLILDTSYSGQLAQSMVYQFYHMGLLQTGEYFFIVLKSNKNYDGSRDNAFDSFPRIYPLRYISEDYDDMLEVLRNVVWIVFNEITALASNYKQFEAMLNETLYDTKFIADHNVTTNFDLLKGGISYETMYKEIYLRRFFSRANSKNVRFYDAFMIWAKTAMSLLASGGSPTDIANGLMISKKIRNNFHDSVMNGRKYFVDANGLTSLEALVLTAQSANDSMYAHILQPLDYASERTMLFQYGIYPVGFVSRNDTTGRANLRFERSLNFLGGAPPVEEPKCGFDGKNSICIVPADPTWKIIGGAMGVVFLICIMMLVFVIRYIQYEKSLMSLSWMISRSELLIQKQSQTFASGSSINSINEENPSTAFIRMQKSHVSLKDYTNNLAKEEKLQKKKEKGQSKNKKKQEEVEVDEWAELEETTPAMLKGKMVSLEKVFKISVDLTRNVRTEIKLMRDLKCENLNPMLGAVHDPPHVFVVSDFCQRGNLQEILDNGTITLDTMFIASLLNDLTKGMLFIHNSALVCHGNLKSTTCLIDARWQLRLSEYGLKEFKQGQVKPLTDEQEATGKLWTAPEILRGVLDGTVCHGTQRGDVYSFGIILHELFGRNGPFGYEYMQPIEFIEKIKTPKNPGAYFRPDLALVNGSAPDYVVNCMKRCWDEEPSERPNFNQIRQQIKPLNKGLKSNIMDNMMTMMERYSNNLEEIVAERTVQLEEERKKSERLLLQMLPKSVAEQLKRGQHVDAESFDICTIYFSDIVGFTSLSSDSTPFQVVALLNDLYTCFDAIIGNYDVYKVETIGDAYMVVSGIPLRNGDNHAGEIASMSLDLLEAVKNFKIRHRPGDNLKLRIGIHSGSCVAGVVGLKMPRYCLFGDTVNTASRMESNGEALKIHCSGDCKKFLDKLGGYTIKERGMVAMKGKGEQLTYWVTGEDRDMRRARIQKESEKYSSLKRTLY